MRRALALAAFGLWACASAGSGDSQDLSVPDDDGGSSWVPDLSGRAYTPTTIHAIDTGAIPDGTLVSLTGVVITSDISSRPASGGCTLRAWVQEPAAPPPAGLDLFYFMSTTAACPVTGGPFTGRTLADNVNVKGKLFISTFAGDGGSLTQHSISVDLVEKTNGGASITPLDVDDPSRFGGYGPGFQANEGMLVALSCKVISACNADGNKLKVKFQPAPYLWGVTGGALFGSSFSARWPGKPGPNGTAYTRIVGVVNTFLTGSIEPRAPADFVP
jgi:hypothetical protein